MEKVLEQLNLTKDQQTKIKNLYEVEKQKYREAKDKSREVAGAFYKAMSDPATSDENLRELHEAMIAAKADEMRSRLNKMLKVRSVLNIEQKSKFQEYMKEHHKKKWGKRGRHSDGNHP
ncbi:MAG: Spy/CpxP family protein refolding chaperone [Bdellovibrionota bacterium]